MIKQINIEGTNFFYDVEHYSPGHPCMPYDVLNFYSNKGKKYHKKYCFFGDLVEKEVGVDLAFSIKLDTHLSSYPDNMLNSIIKSHYDNWNMIKNMTYAQEIKK